MKSPLRITWVFPELNFSGGILANRLFADQMVELGHKVTIVAPQEPARAKAKPWQLRRIAEQLQIRLQLAGRPQHHAQTSRAEVLLVPGNEVRDQHVPEADVILATWWRTMEWVHQFQANKGAKCYFIHGYEIFGGPAWRVDNTYRLPSKQFVVSQWLASVMKQKFNRTDALVVPNGIDPSLFYARPRERGVPPTVGVIYSPVPLKQSHLAFEAIKRVQRKIPSLRVICFGSHPPPRSDVPANFTFTLRPQQSETPDLYRACDCWILPSTTEGFGLPGLEACACGVPVVATRCGGPEDYLRDGDNGFLVPVGSTEQITEAVTKVLTMPAASWQEMSARASAAASRFRWKESARKLEEGLYQAVQERSGLFAQDLPQAPLSQLAQGAPLTSVVTETRHGAHEPTDGDQHVTTKGRYQETRMTGPRLRITWVLPEANLSGGIKSNRLIAEAMMRRGHIVTLFLPKETGKAWPKPWRVRQFSRRVRQEIDTMRSPAHHLMISSVPIVAVDGDEVRAEHLPDADVVVGTWWRTMEWLRSYPASKGKHAYFIRHHELFGGPTDRVIATYRQPSIKLVIARWLQRVMAEDYGDNNSILVPNGIDRAQFGAPPREKNRALTVGFMYGGPVKWKDASTALSALEIMQVAMPDLRVVSFGGHAWLPEHKQPANFEFHYKPAQALIPELYRKCDVWLMPSTSEGFGMPGIEAAACRCPIVSTLCGGPEDYVIDGVTGHLVQVGNPQAMATAALRVLGMNADRWLAMSAASQATANAFDWDVSAKLLERGLYERLGIDQQSETATKNQTEGAIA